MVNFQSRDRSYLKAIKSRALEESTQCPLWPLYKSMGPHIPAHSYECNIFIHTYKHATYTYTHMKHTHSHATHTFIQYNIHTSNTYTCNTYIQYTHNT